MKKKWLDDLKPEDMPTSDLKLVAETCGVETAIQLLEHMPGISIYIPKLERTDLVKSYIIKNFNGSTESAKRLALDLNLSVNHIYNIVHRNTANTIEKKQLCLFQE